MDTLLQLGLANAALATLLAFLAAAVARVCRRPAVVHSLWLLVLLKLLTPPLLALPVPWLDRVPNEAVETVTEPTLAVDPLVLSPIVSDLGPEESTNPTRFLNSLPEEDQGAVPPDPGEPPVPRPKFFWQSVVAGGWITGSLFWWTLAGWRLTRFRTLLRLARPAPTELQEQVQRLARRLGLVRAPGVWFVPAPLPPLLWALVGTPRLLLPADLWRQLTDEQRDTLLVHELAHWRRGDHWVRWLELVALGLYWWHPVAWWARRELQVAEEQCCDAWVVWALPASGPAYADALLATLTYLSRSAPALPAGASGVGRLHPIKRRLTMILHGTTPRALSWLAFLGVLTLAGLLPLRPTWAQPAPPSAPAADEPKAAAPALPRPDPLLLPAAQPAPEKPVELAQAQAANQQARREAEEKARDEVELAEVQVALKEAELREARTHVQQAKRQLNRIGQLAKARAVSEAEIAKAQDDVELAEVQAEQKTYQVREVQLKLQQAKRRLANLQPPTPPPPTRSGSWLASPSGALPARQPAESLGLKELEKKLDSLLKEVEALRRELQQRKSSAAERGGDGEIVVLNSRNFQIPIRLEPDSRNKVNGVELWVSPDEGRTWKLAEQRPLDAKAFTFMAPEDGLYWFTVRTIDDKSRPRPDDVVLGPALLKVRVETR